MEEGKKECAISGVSLPNNPNLNVDSDKDVDNEKIENNKVNFHSDFINEKVGDLDITV